MKTDLHSPGPISFPEGANPAITAKAAYVDAWLAHAWDGFPREFSAGDGSKKWQVVTSEEQYLRLLQMQHEDFGPAHTSINIGLGSALAPTYARQWINKILLELDSPNGRLENGYQEMRRLYARIRLQYDSSARIYFSGHRSFHLFIDFSPIAVKEPVEAQREFARRLVKDLSIA